MTHPDRVAGAEGRAFGADPPCRSGTAGVRAGLAGGPTGLTCGPNPAGGGLSPHCFTHTLLVPAGVMMLRPGGTQMSPPPVESAAGQRDRPLRDDRPGVVHRPRRPPPDQHAGRCRPRPVTRRTWASRSAPVQEAIPDPPADTTIRGRHAVFLTGNVPSAGSGQDLRQALCSQFKGTFSRKRPRLICPRRKPEVSADHVIDFTAQELHPER